MSLALDFQPSRGRTAVALRIDEGLEPWERLASSEVGVVKELVELKVEVSEPPLFIYLARCGPNLKLLGAHRPASIGSGVGLDRRTALAAAVGEAAERYCSAFIQDPDRMIEANLRELQEEAILPDELALFSDGQYSRGEVPFPRFEETTRVTWVLMHRIEDRTPVRVPVQFVYLGHPRRPGVAELCLHVSSGLACAADPELALLKGLYEANERDAFNIVWLNRLPVARLVVSASGDAELEEMLDRVKTARLRAEFAWLTLDTGIPTVLCCVRDVSGTRPAAAVGAASSLSPVQAARKAAAEAIHTRQWLWSLFRKEGWRRYSRDFREVQDFDDHVLLYRSHAMAERLAFLWKGQTEVSLRSLSDLSQGNPAADLEVCRKLLARAGLRVLYKDLTTPDVASVGLYVVRTFVPGFQNINGPHAQRLLGGRRLYEVPVNVGLRERPAKEEELNPNPHPFP